MALLTRCKQPQTGCTVQQALCVWECGALRHKVQMVSAKCEILRQLAQTKQLFPQSPVGLRTPGRAGVNSPSFQQMKRRVVSGLKEATECLETSGNTLFSSELN